MDPKQALDLTFDCSDLAETVTIRQYFKELLTTLFEEGEGFSGKRPFGNSGWEYDIVKPLIEAKVISGSLDEEGYPESFDPAAFNAYVAAMIEAL